MRSIRDEEVRTESTRRRKSKEKTQGGNRDVVKMESSFALALGSFSFLPSQDEPMSILKRSAVVVRDLKTYFRLAGWSRQLMVSFDLKKGQTLGIVGESGLGCP